MSTIDQKIRQKKFRNEFQKLVINLTYTYSRIAAEIETLLSPFGITVQQFNILRILRGQTPHSATVTLIRQRLVDKNADVSRLIDRLLKKGLLTRDICPKDRRRVDIRITKHGLDLLEKIDREEDKFDAVCSGLTVEEARELNRLLDKLGK
jgi:DNA-binding MarR family transcriptional regulator